MNESYRYYDEASCGPIEELRVVSSWNDVYLATVFKEFFPPPTTTILDSVSPAAVMIGYNDTRAVMNREIATFASGGRNFGKSEFMRLYMQEPVLPDDLIEPKFSDARRRDVITSKGGGFPIWGMDW